MEPLGGASSGIIVAAYIEYSLWGPIARPLVALRIESNFVPSTPSLEYLSSPGFAMRLILVLMLLTASVWIAPASAEGQSEVTWSLDHTVLRTEEESTWISSTAIPGAFPSYDYTYEITSVSAFLGGLIEPQDLTEDFAAIADLTGSGSFFQTPSTLGQIPIDEPTTGTTLDLAISITASGFGRIDFTEIDLGVVITDFGETQTPIDGLQFEGVFTVTGSQALPGDYNGDGDVDNDDYLFWQLTFGSTSILEADGNNNGVVDVADYTVWRDAAAIYGAGLTVPEPISAWTVLVAVITVGAARRAD